MNDRVLKMKEELEIEMTRKLLDFKEKTNLGGSHIELLVYENCDANGVVDHTKVVIRVII